LTRGGKWGEKIGPQVPPKEALHFGKENAPKMRTAKTEKRCSYWDSGKGKGGNGRIEN